MEIIANTADELFDLTLNAMKDINDTIVAKELINANLVLLNPVENTMLNCIRKFSLKYAICEHLWYNSCNNKLSSINKYSKFWNKVSDDGETVNSNYGWCIRCKYDFDQWEITKKLLQQCPTTRQAVMHIKEARNLIENPSKDVNCTLTLQFILRDNKLDLIVNMRSNDIWLGLPYDLFNFTCMQIQMAMELNVDVGIYYHNVGSLHMYRRNLDKIGGTNDSNS